jgi:Na+-driven multidrug efflux pump
MIGCTAVCLWFPEILIGIFSSHPDVIYYGIVYLRIFSIGFVMVGTIMVVSAAFQGLGKTYPSLIGAVVDNALFAGLVFTLPVYFGWGIQSIWWIKLATAAAETAIVAVWLRYELAKVRSNFPTDHQPAGLQPV